MKKIYMLLLLLSLSTRAFSQQKPAFGFIVKAGTYTVPSSKTEYNVDYSYATSTTSQKPGNTYAIGIYQSLPLNAHFSLSGELIYRYASYQGVEKRHEEWLEGNYRYEQQRSTGMSSISLPIKLHYAYQKNGKLSFFVGGGISRDFSTTEFYHTLVQSNPFPASTYSYSNRYSDWEDFQTVFNFTTGINYKLDASTSIGLEYTYENKADNYNIYKQYPFNLVDCICYYYNPVLGVNMHNFSVSLRHNILK